MSGRDGWSLGTDAGDEHVLDVQVLVNPDRAALAAVARLLDAAEGRVGSADDPRVRADDPVLELLGNAQQPCVVPRVEVRTEAVDRVVGEPDRLLLRLEAGDAGDGAER